MIHGAPMELRTVADEDEMVSVGEEFRKIVAVEPAERRTIRVTWEDGTVEAIDLTNYIANHRAFFRLREDDDYFRSVRIEQFGWAIFWGEWSEGAAIPVDGLDEAAGRGKSWE